MEFDELSGNVTGVPLRSIEISGPLYLNRHIGSVWRANCPTRGFHFSWRCRWLFVTNRSCSTAAARLICSVSGDLIVEIKSVETLLPILPS